MTDRVVENMLRQALRDVRQELWVDYCLGMGRTDTNPAPFNSRPHIRIIDDAISAASTVGVVEPCVGAGAMLGAMPRPGAK